MHALRDYREALELNAHHVDALREMRLFQKFRLETRILWWDEKQSVIEQLFILDGGKHDGHVAAQAMFKGGLYDRASRQFVPIARLMDEVGFKSQSPAMRIGQA